MRLPMQVNFLLQGASATSENLRLMQGGAGVGIWIQWNAPSVPNHWFGEAGHERSRLSTIILRSTTTSTDVREVDLTRTVYVPWKIHLGAAYPYWVLPCVLSGRTIHRLLDLLRSLRNRPPIRQMQRF